MVQAGSAYCRPQTAVGSQPARCGTSPLCGGTPLLAAKRLLWEAMAILCRKLVGVEVVLSPFGATPSGALRPGGTGVGAGPPSIWHRWPLEP